MRVEVGALTLAEQVNIMKADLLAKFQRGDWHGVRDAAVDIELLEKEIAVRRATAEVHGL